MAEPPDGLDEGVPAAEVPVEAEAPAARRAPRFGIFLTAVILLAAAVGGVFSYAFYIDIATTVTAALTRVGLADDPSAPRTFGQFSELEGVIINPAATSGQRYLMLNIGLEAQTTSILDEVKQKEVVVRDTVLKVLGSQSVEELSDITRRNELKESLRSAVNSVLRNGQIDHLYFTRYVLQ